MPLGKFYEQLQQGSQLWLPAWEVLLTPDLPLGHFPLRNIHPSGHPSIRLAVYWFLSISVHHSVWPSLHPFIHTSVHLSICTCLHRFIHSSICPFIQQMLLWAPSLYPIQCWVLKYGTSKTLPLALPKDPPAQASGPWRSTSCYSYSCSEVMPDRVFILHLFLCILGDTYRDIWT